MTYWNDFLAWFNAQSKTKQGLVLVGLAIALLCLLALIDTVV